MSMDKITIEGAEFTRIAERYLLQSEVEDALSRTRPGTAPHVQQLTTLLEDIVTTADAVALEVAEAQSRAAAAPAAMPKARVADRTEGVRQLLRQLRDGLRDQISIIDAFLQRLED